MDSTLVTNAPLRYRLIRPTAPTPATAVIALCHGFGAPGDDLVGLVPELTHRQPSLSKAAFVFPEAPIDLADYGFPRGARAWWMVDVGRFAAMSTANEQALGELMDEEPEGLSAARKKLAATLDSVLLSLRQNHSRLTIGGFSQGAMLATDYALRQSERPAGLVALSGALICRGRWKERAAGRAGLPMFQSHGRNDPILPIAGAEALATLCREAQFQHQFHPFAGGHAIPEAVIAKLAEWLVKHSTTEKT